MPGPVLSERDLAVLRSFARRIDPSDAGAHNNLGVLYYQKGLIQEAIAEFVPGASARSAHAGRAEQSGHRLSRERALRPPYRGAPRAGRRAPDDREARWSWAAPTPRWASRRGRGRIPGAARRRPADVAAMVQLGLAEKARGNIETAGEWLRQACERDPESAVARFYLRRSAVQPRPQRAALRRSRGGRAQSRLRRGALPPRVRPRRHGRSRRGRGSTAKRAIELNPLLARAQANLALERARRSRRRGAPTEGPAERRPRAGRWRISSWVSRSGRRGTTRRRSASTASRSRRARTAATPPGDGRSRSAPPRSPAALELYDERWSRSTPTRRSCGTSVAYVSTSRAGWSRPRRRTPGPWTSTPCTRSRGTIWASIRAQNPDDPGASRRSARALEARAPRLPRGSTLPCFISSVTRSTAPSRSYRAGAGRAAGQRRRLERRGPRTGGAQALCRREERIRARGRGGADAGGRPL